MRLRSTITATLLIAAPLSAQSWQEDVLSPRGAIDRHVTSDFNGDGAADVFAVGPALSMTGSRAAFLYLGNGDGTFLRQGKVQRGLPKPDRLIACDVNGDGNEDAVLLDTTMGRVVLIAGDGQGGFAAPALLAGLGGSGAETPGSLRCIDGDGDGDLDVYFSVRNIGVADGIYWVEQTAPNVFAPASPLTPPAFPVFSFDLADFDADGDMDVASAAGVRGVVWFRNDGTMALTGPMTIQSGLDAGKSRDVRAFDIDRNGVLDLVGTNDANNVRIAYYENLGGGTFGTASPIAQMTDPLFGICAADLDGDGFDDLGFELFTRRCEAVLVLGGASFSPRFPVVSPAWEISAFDLADLDGDGSAEGVFSGRQLYNIVGGSVSPVLSYSRNLGQSGTGIAFEQNIPIEPFSYYTTAMEVADVNGDGAPDLIVAGGQPRPLTVFINSGDGSLSGASQIPIDGRRLLSLAAADVDGDLDVDLMYTVNLSSGTEVVLARNDGDGRSWSVSTYEDDGTSVLGVGDLEGDGDSDVFLTVLQPPVFNLALAVAENLGGGVVGTPRNLLLFNGATGGTFEDIDGDGDADFILGTFPPGSGTYQVHYYRRDAGDVIVGPTVLDVSTGAAQPGVSPAGFNDFVAADFDGDGDRDVIALGQYVNGGAVRFYRQTATSVFDPPVIIAPTPTTGGAVGLEALDGDADGDLDLILSIYRSSSEPGEIHYYENTPGGVFVGPTLIPTVAVDPSYIASADFDLDGDQDFITSGYWIDNDEHFSLFTNDLRDTLGDGYCLPAVPNSTGLPGSIAVVGSSLVQDNVARLRAWDLPRSTTGFFLTSRTPGQVTSVPGSVGILCLGGQIGRFAGPGQVLNTGSTGTMALDVDLQVFPNPALGTVSVLAGERWYFQGWSRDAVGGMVTSNFTAATTVTWR